MLDTDKLLLSNDEIPAQMDLSSWKMLSFSVLPTRKSRNVPVGFRQGRVQVLYVS